MRRRLLEMPRSLRITLIISLVLFAASLTMTAVIVHDGEKQVSLSSIVMLVMGSFCFTAGAWQQWVIWLANPLYLMALLLLVYDKRGAVSASLGAFLLALSFGYMEVMQINSSGKAASILVREEGYWFWLLSLFIAFLGSLYYFFVRKKMLLDAGRIA